MLLPSSRVKGVPSEGSESGDILPFTTATLTCMHLHVSILLAGPHTRTLLTLSPHTHAPLSRTLPLPTHIYWVSPGNTHTATLTPFYYIHLDSYALANTHFFLFLFFFFYRASVGITHTVTFSLFYHRHTHSLLYRHSHSLSTPPPSLPSTTASLARIFFSFLLGWRRPNLITGRVYLHIHLCPPPLYRASLGITR